MTVRNTDPETSVKAAFQSRSDRSLRRLQFMFALGVLKRGTANEIARYASVENHALHESIRKRAHELVRAGLIREAGLKTCEVTGREATVYDAVHPLRKPVIDVNKEATDGGRLD